MSRSDASNGSFHIFQKILPGFLDKQLYLLYNYSRNSLIANLLQVKNMRILISYESGVPIYEQIKTELRGQIIRGDLPADTLLPSIRTLAKELKIGIITAKRAYDDLCAEGFIYTVQGKGIYVASFDKSKAESYAVGEIRTRLKEIAAFADCNSVDRDTVKKLIDEIW